MGALASSLLLFGYFIYVPKVRPVGVSNMRPVFIRKIKNRWMMNRVSGIVPRPGKQYLEKFKVYVPGFDTTGIQWMRYGPDSPVHSLISLSPT